MLRSLAVPSLLLMLLMTTSLNIDARGINVKMSTTLDPIEDTTYMHLPDGTITVDIDSDEILTTSPEGETFSEPSPLELTEEPLPDSVIRPKEKEQAQEVQAREEVIRNPFDLVADTEITTEINSEKKSSKKGYKFGASMPMGFNGFYIPKSEDMSTTEHIADTTIFEDYTTVKNFVKQPTRPARPTRPDRPGRLDLEIAENRMDTTTDVLALKDKKQDYFTSPDPIMTTDPSESVPTQSPLFRIFTTSTVKPLFMETQPETTTMWPESRKEEETTMPVMMESTEVPLSSTTQVTESITEPAQATTIPAPSSVATTGPEPLTARMELYLNMQSPVSEVLETTITTSAPEITTVPETTILSISAPETTTSTTSAPEITTSTTNAPETTTSTSSAPETTTSTTSAPEITTSTTTSTTIAPETTTSTSRAPETTTSTTSGPETTTSTISAPLATIPSTKAPEATTTTPRPTLTRAPRVERIFNSDGVEVLYGYSSVVRTNRS